MIIEARNLRVSFNGVEILRGISIAFDSGVHIVLGRNGAGKTTFLRALANLVRFDGDVLVGGRSIKKMSRREIAMLIGYCWQNPYYGFVEATVEDEIRAITRILGVSGDWRVVELLVPRDYMGRDPSTLSGGEAKRVSMASILVADQPIWLLDEPFTYLDRDGVEAVASLIDYGRRRGKTIIVTLHEMFYADLIKPDTYAIIDGGTIKFFGRWSSLSDEELAKAGLVPRGVICDTLCSPRGPGVQG